MNGSPKTWILLSTCIAVKLNVASREVRKTCWFRNHSVAIFGVFCVSPSLFFLLCEDVCIRMGCFAYESYLLSLTMASIISDVKSLKT